MKKKSNIKYDGKTILEIQKTLGERIDVTLDKTLSPEERELENAQTALVLMMAKQMINAGAGRNTDDDRGVNEWY